MPDKEPDSNQLQEKGWTAERMRATHVGVRAGLALCLLLLGPVPHDVDHPRSQAEPIVDVRSQMGQHDESLERVGLPELLEALARKMVEELRGDEEEGDGGHDVEVDREEFALELPERQSSCRRSKRERDGQLAVPFRRTRRRAGRRDGRMALNAFTPTTPFQMLMPNERAQRTVCRALRLKMAPSEARSTEEGYAIKEEVGGEEGRRLGIAATFVPKRP